MDLGQYIKRVLRWWWLFIICTLVAGGVSFIVSSQQPRVYQTTSTLMVGQFTQTANPSGQDFYTIELLAESYAQMAVRRPILQATIDSLGLQTNWQALKGQVYAASVPRTQLLAIAVQDNSPEQAMAIANEIANQLILQSPTSPENEIRQEQAGFVKRQLASLKDRIERAEERLIELQSELDSAFSASQIQDAQSEISGLETLINTWQSNYAELSNFLQGGASPNYLTIIEPAQLPYTPIKPNIPLNVLLAAATGFVLAVGAAMLLEYLDNTIKTPEDLQNADLGLTHIGNIIRIKGKSYKDQMAVTHTPFSPIAEGYRLLRTNIQFMAVDRPIKVIMVSSSSPKEGKSTTVVNLGVVMAQAGLRTIIVDADLRLPTIHRIFQTSNATGLTTLLCSKELDLENQLKNTGYENLQAITSGPLPPNSSEMLGSKRMGELIDRLKEIADVIILDTPPVLAVTDAAVLSSRADGVVLVALAKRTRRDTLKQAVKRLQQVHANLLGTVLNQASDRAEGGNYYYSSYYASSRQNNRASQPWWRRLLPLK
jgi:non-specific protein-tyrosine kinase